MNDSLTPKKELALEHLLARWHAIFTCLQQGGEVPPSQRLRAEGMMQILVELEMASAQQLQAAMAACYLRCYGQALPADWADLFPFPQIPGFGVRAPVYPSTHD
jgi:hypothetical protein